MSSFCTMYNRDLLVQDGNCTIRNTSTGKNMNVEGFIIPIVENCLGDEGYVPYIDSNGFLCISFFVGKHIQFTHMKFDVDYHLRVYMYKPFLVVLYNKCTFVFHMDTKMLLYSAYDYLYYNRSMSHYVKLKELSNEDQLWIDNSPVAILRESFIRENYFSINEEFITIVGFHTICLYSFDGNCIYKFIVDKRWNAYSCHGEFLIIHYEDEILLYSPYGELLNKKYIENTYDEIYYGIIYVEGKPYIVYETQEDPDDEDNDDEYNHDGDHDDDEDNDDEDNDDEDNDGDA